MAHLHTNKTNLIPSQKHSLFMNEKELEALRDMVHWEYQNRRDAINQGADAETLLFDECEAIAKALQPQQAAQ